MPADVLLRFPELVRSLGGDPERILKNAGINPHILARAEAAIPLRAMVRLLGYAQADLKHPDFGMRLAQAQRGVKQENLFELVMRNSPTLGDAFHFCAQHLQTYSGGMGMNIDHPADEGRSFLRFEILLPWLYDHGQAIEHMLLRTCNILRDMSGNRAGPLEVCFSHQPQAPKSSYLAHFGCNVRFGQPASGFFVHSRDLDAPVVGADAQVHRLATHFIQSQFPVVPLPFGERVTMLVARLLDSQACTSDHIAARLGLHQRTLQRRLRDEGTCFETIKDEVRRETAKQFLGRPDVSLSRLAEMLGYSEVSALSRSCHRWFSASPRRLRKDLAAWGEQAAA